MTPRQRAVLLEHMDRPDGVPVFTVQARRMVALKALVSAGLLRSDGGRRTRLTFATDTGREMICRLLAAEADIAYKQFRKRNGDWTSQRQGPSGQWMRKRAPLRDRAAYMRDYKRKRREEAHANG